uniref:Pentraxin (PTX) domain-containing protein n=1 Tax=Knipowitschia caucasica TaxID=637954 RepID=A0AAV2MGX8_KNICA
MKLHSKLDDLEGRSRCNNIKIVGIPEGEEKGRPTEFVTSLIPKLLEQGNLAKQVIVDRAHRVPMPRATSTQRPRSIIARIHFYQEKEMLLRLSRQNQLVYNGARIFIYPDYTADVMTQRRGFRDVMQALREKEVTFILRFPARLQVNYEDQGLLCWRDIKEVSEVTENRSRDAGPGRTNHKSPKMKFLVCLVMLICNALAISDLSGKMFVFPVETDTDHVKITPSQSSLHALTVCHRSFTDLTRSHTMFSMATPSNANAFITLIRRVLNLMSLLWLNGQPLTKKYINQSPINGNLIVVLGQEQDSE